MNLTTTTQITETKSYSDKSLVSNINWYPEQINYLACKSCRVNKICPEFKEKYSILYAEAKEIALKKIKELDSKIYYDYINKELNKELIERDWKMHMLELLSKEESSCVYEKQRAAEIYTDFNEHYQLNTNPTLKYSVYNLISQIIIQLRLQKNINMNDIVNVKLIHTKQGPAEIEVVSTGMSYMMQVNADIIKTLEKINNIIEPIKVEVKGEVTFKDVMKKIMEIPNK